MLRLRDDAIAFDFDNCAAMRLQQWEDERENARETRLHELLAVGMGVTFGA